MDKTNFIDTLTEVIKEYIATEEAYSDDACLEINTRTWDMTIVDSDNELPGCDYYSMLDLVLMSGSHPGEWEPDPVAVESVASEYFPAG